MQLLIHSCISNQPTPYLLRKGFQSNDVDCESNVHTEYDMYVSICWMCRMRVHMHIAHIKYILYVVCLTTYATAHMQLLYGHS